MKYKTITRLSPSSIIKLLSDYKGWYRTYVLGEREPNNVYFEFGTAFHGMLEDFFNDKPKEDETIKSYTEKKYTELWSKWFEDNETLQEFMNEDVGITMDRAEKWTYDYLKKWVEETIIIEEKKGTEKAFELNSPSITEWHLEDEELKTHGYVDAYYGKDKYSSASGFLHTNTVEDLNPIEMGSLICDYKTSKVDRNTNNTKYFLQTMIYALIYQRQNKRRKIKFISVDYLKYGRKFYYYIPEDMFQRIEKLIKDTWLLVNKVNENPEEYKDKPPMKIRLNDYI